ncbi:hypothetical protein Pyrfu_1297 [Pyrolobus fumarii 1A]|uniref:Uncharacterized protein n=1 Tax=Pyrolobus fumarii (strain DSM 11204 / 1A) TaxID=694429 RepID=G0EGD1_PYRF1|nr:hypothetical protein [Pyrolobus fumarii]AEM39156.1 hypothetical protein Pyrfu_1297 [Pyrolobus fumarii 1A]
MPLLLRLLVSEEDLIPLLLGFTAVNGDLRLYTQYLSSLCHNGRGGSRRVACRFLEHMATVKEPLLALEKLSKELGGSGALLNEIVRSLRLGVEPAEVAERLVERIIARVRAKAELVDDIAKAMLEVLALVSTVLTFSILMSGFLLGGGAGIQLAAFILAGIVGLAAMFTPSVVRLSAPRVPRIVTVTTIASMISGVYSIYAHSLLAALISTVLSLPAILYTARWWRQTRSVASIAVGIAESLQMGRGIPPLGAGDPSLTYSILMGSKYSVYSNLGELLVDMLRLIPQEGSVTAAKLLRSFTEFAARYLELVKTALTKSIVYETIVVIAMPLLALLAKQVLGVMNTATVANAPIPLLRTGLHGGKELSMMLLPAVAYPLATSKIGRGTPLLPLLHWLPSLLAVVLL